MWCSQSTPLGGSSTIEEVITRAEREQRSFLLADEGYAVLLGEHLPLPADDNQLVLIRLHLLYSSGRHLRIESAGKAFVRCNDDDPLRLISGIYEGMRDRDKLATLWSRLAQVYMREGKNIGALQSLRKSLEYQEENGTPRVAVDEIVGNLQNLFEIQCRRRWYLAAVKTLLRGLVSLSDGGSGRLCLRHV